jgi:starch synthase
VNIISVSAEVAPWSKTGGLGDVCGALPKALAKRGHRVMTVAPRYAAYEDAWDTGSRIDLDGHVIGFHHCKQRGVDRVFVDHPAILRGGIYGDSSGSFSDNWFRFSLLCQGALLAAARLPLDGRTYTDGDGADTAFLFHDWHASLVPAYMETARMWGGFGKAASALVIHNLAHQGTYDHKIFGKLSLPAELLGHLDMGGRLNLLKGGMALADKIITVSPTYAKEICTREYGVGLEGILQARKENLVGILNGVDTEAWDPSTDKELVARYSPKDLSGKAKCKLALQRELGLPPRLDAPLFGFISRLDFQKGVDQLESVLPWLLSQGAQVVMLGTGDPKLEAFLHQAGSHPRVAGLVTFSNALAHKITAGSDFLLMPSRFEPCGLTQQHALRYGTVPIAHATGGLRDTVLPFNPWRETGNGWVFSPLKAEAFQQALAWGLQTFIHSKGDFRKIQLRGMLQDRSWDIAAEKYERVLAGALKRRARLG